MSGQTFIGMELSQNWRDINIWETFFKEFKVASLIELGTGNGGMSLYFALQGYQRKMYFHTFDNQKWIDFNNGLPKMLRMQEIFHHVDLFSEEGIRQVTELILTMPKPLAIFFDDGDKPREWGLFAALTSPGDFCIVHDWGTEFKESDIGNVPVKRILVPECNARPKNSWKAMWFERI